MDVRSILEKLNVPFQSTYNGIEKIVGPSENRQQRLDQENIASLRYAKENNVWFDSLSDLASPLGGGGAENTLAYNEKDGYVYKSNNLFFNEGSVLKLLNRTQAHNAIFPEIAYQLVGFTGIDNGRDRVPLVHVIIKQKYLTDARQTRTEETDRHMSELGYLKDEDTYDQGEIMIGDLSPRNILVAESVIYPIDPIIDFGDSLSNLNEVQSNFIFKEEEGEVVNEDGITSSKFQQDHFRKAMEGIAKMRIMTIDEAQDQQMRNSKDHLSPTTAQA